MIYKLQKVHVCEIMLYLSDDICFFVYSAAVYLYLHLYLFIDILYMSTFARLHLRRLLEHNRGMYIV